MIYFLIFIVLIVSELLYLRIAIYFNIIDKPNIRSSHSQATLKGGGIIYWVAALLYASLNPSVGAGWFFTGITLIAVVSFWNDIKNIGQMTRLFCHVLAMSFVFFLVNIFGVYPWWAILIGYIVMTGTVNAFNFMDGINGITGLYTLAVLLPMIYVNNYIQTFTETDFLLFPLMASVVFLFFNLRERTKCFTGDVGSVSIAFWIVTLLLQLIIKTQNLIWIGFLLVYGVDTVCTILHRIYLKQNIMKAHRLHFYQILANEMKTDHREVSLAYFIAQLICSSLIINLYPIIGWWIFIILASTLTAIYGMKFRLMKAASYNKLI